VRGNDFLFLWLPCINPLNMQSYLSCYGTWPTPTEVGQQSIVRAIEAHLTGSMVSSSSSSKSGQNIRNLIRERREAKNLYSEATFEVG
jgi:hypothetical protein